MALKRSILFLISSLLISGCAHYPVNAPLQRASSGPRGGYRFESMAAKDQSDDLLLMLAFSGGGTRAAALSYGVLEQLRDTKLGSVRTEHQLLDDVDLISSVSGGSFTAAYYALHGDGIFVDFEKRFLKKRVQTGLLLRTLAPWNQMRLASPRFSRSDLAAEFYDSLLFNHATFADLSGPFLSINATDVSSGARFEFTQDEFDLISSDISSFPVSRAVAASSAFPILLSPVVLKNYSAGEKHAEPGWIETILRDPSVSSRLKYVASQARSYADGNRRFIHLVDGGLSDNLGLRGGLDRAMAREQFTRVPGLPAKIPRRVAIIIVDAHTESDYGWDSREHSVGLPSLLNSLSQVAVSHYSFETTELFREVMMRLSREHSGERSEISPYVIELHFRQVAVEADRKFFNSVPTKLQLPSGTVDRLREMARSELAANTDFQRLVRDLRNAPEDRIRLARDTSQAEEIANPITRIPTSTKK